MEASQSQDQSQSPSPQADQPQQAQSRLESQGERLTLEDTGVKDDIAEALAAAREAVPMDASMDAPQEDGQTGEGAKEGATSEDAEAGPPSEPASKEPDTTQRPAPAPETDKVRPSQWARLHREQKDFFAQKQAHQADIAEMQRVKGILENAKSDRLAALEVMGYTDIKSFIEGLAEDGGRMTPERRELNELKAWRKTQEEAANQQKAEAAEREQQAALQGKLDALRTQVQGRIKSEQYSSRIINLKDADEQVMLEMDRMATETGQMPEVDEAIERVEGRFQAYLEEMATNPAVRDFFAGKMKAQQSAPTATPQSKQREKTRTIAGNVPSPGLNPQGNRRRSASSDDDDVEDAIAWLKTVAR